jgi:hypothetical protein
MSGWIKIHREITDHWLYKEKRKFSRFEAWNDILLTVNYSEAQTIIKGKLYTVKKGESLLSLDSWAKRWNWDKSSVRRFLTMLQNETMINLVSDNISTRLIVCKWDIYQEERNANETQTKRKRNANDIQTTPIKEEEENKKEKNINNSNKLELLNKRKIEFSETLSPFLTKYGKDMLNEFFSYWTEPNKSLTKLKFELQKTWSVELRLSTWARNNKNFKTSNNGKTNDTTRSERQSEYLSNVLRGNQLDVNSQGTNTIGENGSFDAYTIAES